MIVLDSLGPIFQLTMEAFPFVFNPFLEMCKSLIQLPGNFDTVSEIQRTILSIYSTN